MDEPPATTDDAAQAEDVDSDELDRIAWNLPRPSKRPTRSAPEEPDEAPPGNELTPAA